MKNKELFPPHDISQTNNINHVRSPNLELLRIVAMLKITFTLIYKPIENCLENNWYKLSQMAASIKEIIHCLRV